jgi:hypothetical protein
MNVLYPIIKALEWEASNPQLYCRYDNFDAREMMHNLPFLALDIALG